MRKKGRLPVRWRGYRGVCQQWAGPNLNQPVDIPATGHSVFYTETDTGQNARIAFAPPKQEQHQHQHLFLLDATAMQRWWSSRYGFSSMQPTSQSLNEMTTNNIPIIFPSLWIRYIQIWIKWIRWITCLTEVEEWSLSAWSSSLERLNAEESNWRARIFKTSCSALRCISHNAGLLLLLLLPPSPENEEAKIKTSHLAADRWCWCTRLTKFTASSNWSALITINKWYHIKAENKTEEKMCYRKGMKVFWMENERRWIRWGLQREARLWRGPLPKYIRPEPRRNSVWLTYRYALSATTITSIIRISMVAVVTSRFIS